MLRALITGITGQDGSYLTEFLLEKGYEVHGLVRRTSSLERSRLVALYEDPEIYGRRLFLHYSDVEDPTTLRRVLFKVRPSEIYHLAGQSHVGLSFEIPESTCEMTGMGTLRLLEMVRDLPDAVRVFHASSSEIFGKPASAPQDEETPMKPVNPYGCAKAFATRMVGIYRETFGLFACNGIMYNHESPRRGENFVTRKICRAAAAIKRGVQDRLQLGDLSAGRDWGFAPDYVRGMWMALNQGTAEDFVFATGIVHTVQDLVETAFRIAGLDWSAHVGHDSRLLRPVESTNLVGNAAKATRLLGWKPTVQFATMVQAELDLLPS